MKIDLKDVQRLHLEPGDTLVLRLAHDLDEATREAFAAELQEVFPTHHTLVLGPGASLEVVEAAK